MNNPLFWLGISILLVAISLMALLVVAVFTLQELARAARSAEKLLDTLNREMPATLQDLRLTGKELAVLSDEVSGSVQSARSVVQQVDQGLIEAKVHAQRATVTTRSLFAGATAAFRVLTGQPRRRRSRPPTRRPPVTPTAAKSPIAVSEAETPKSQAVGKLQTVDKSQAVDRAIDRTEAKTATHTAPTASPETSPPPTPAPAITLSNQSQTTKQTQPAKQEQPQTSQIATESNQAE